MIKLIKNFVERATMWLKEKDCTNCEHGLTLKIKYSQKPCTMCIDSGCNAYWRPKK